MRKIHFLDHEKETEPREYETNVGQLDFSLCSRYGVGFTAHEKLIDPSEAKAGYPREQHVKRANS